MAIGEICSREVVFVARSESCAQAARLMRDNEGLGRAIALMRAEGVRRLPVVDADGNLVGVLAADDLIELFADELSGLAAMIGKSARFERAERRAAL